MRLQNIIKLDWTKIPGPNFVGGPDGRIKDLEDWRILVKAHLLLQAAQELTRVEANDSERFADAERRVMRMIYEKVYGDIRDELLQRLRELKMEVINQCNYSHDPDHPAKRVEALMEYINKEMLPKTSP